MHRRTLILTLTLACGLVVGTAHAAVRASGLLCEGTGIALLGPCPDSRCLQMSNIGSSGQDGCNISLGGATGHRVSSSSMWSGSHDGVVHSFSWSTSNASTGAGSSSHATVTLTRQLTATGVFCDASSMSASPSATCLLYLGGGLVSSFSCPSSFSYELQSPPATLCAVPEVTFELDSPSNRCLSSVSVSCGAVFVFGGMSLDVDRVVVVSGLDDDLVLDECAVRSSFPLAISPGTLELDSQSFVQFGSSVALADFDRDGLQDLVSLSVNPLYVSGSMTVESPLFERVFGQCSSGGGGGGGCGGVALSSLDGSSPPSSLHFSRFAPLVLDPATDEGASLVSRVLVTGGCSPTGEGASLRVLVLPHVLEVQGSFTGMCADQESLIVKSRGVVVARTALTLGQNVLVGPLPGFPSKMSLSSVGKTSQVTRSNISNNLMGPDDDSSTGSGGNTVPAPTSASSVVGPDGLDLSVAFLDQHSVCVDGTCVSGDEITISGQCTSGACNVITVVGSNFELQRCSDGSCSPSSSLLEVTDVSSSGIDQIAAVIPATVSLSSSTPSVYVPVVMDKVFTGAVRGTSVRLHLSPNLVLASSILELDHFSRFGASQMFVVDNGGGSFTVDCALLGPGCGPTSSGALFSIPIMRAPGAPDGLAFVSIDEVEVADCLAGPVPSSPGGKAFIVLDGTAPAATTLSVTQVLSGNDGDGTTRNNFQLGALAVEDYVELYRASFGNYPDYDEGPAAGSVPPMPTYPPSGRWSPVSMTCSSSAVGGPPQCGDEPSSRDFYYYVVYVRDRAGNTSPASSMTGGTLNYHLGDVSDGVATCSGDNQVFTSDISALGSLYGTTLSVGSTFECLDVGPTSDGSVAGRPLTDHRLSFKDLMMYAINYSLVSMPASAPRVVAASTNALRLAIPAPGDVGETFDVAVEMEGAGDVQGLSLQLAWNAAVVEPVSVSAGDLMAQQGRQGLVLSAEPGNVDAALFGAGTGIAGRGTLARVTFRVRTAGDPAIAIAGIDARDGRNQSLAMLGVTPPGAAPGRTALRMAFPNPFDQSTTVVLSLRSAGPASVGVFDVAGRHVRTLLDGVQAAGERIVSWDGRDDSGARLGAGVYMLRLDAGGHSETRAVRLVK